MPRKTLVLSVEADGEEIQVETYAKATKRRFLRREWPITFRNPRIKHSERLFLRDARAVVAKPGEVDDLMGLGGIEIAIQTGETQAHCQVRGAQLLAAGSFSRNGIEYRITVHDMGLKEYEANYHITG